MIIPKLSLGSCYSWFSLFSSSKSPKIAFNKATQYNTIFKKGKIIFL